MSYTLATGVEIEPLDKIQWGLLLGLPTAAGLFIIGILIRHQALPNPPSVSPKIIPVVSSIETPAAGSSGSDGSGGSAISQPDTSAAPLSAATAGGTSAPATLTGGMGSGPTTSQGGVLPLNYTLYIPPADVQAGSKPVVTSSGSTIFVN